MCMLRSAYNAVWVRTYNTVWKMGITFLWEGVQTPKCHSGVRIR
jgi:hypothetical protein